MTPTTTQHSIQEMRHYQTLEHTWNWNKDKRERIFEKIMAKNFPKIMNNSKLQIQRAHINSKKMFTQSKQTKTPYTQLDTSQWTYWKPKIKRKFWLQLGGKREEHIICRGTKIRIRADFSSETRQAKKKWSTSLKYFKKKIKKKTAANLKFSALNKSFKMTKIKTFSEKQ